MHNQSMRIFSTCPPSSFSRADRYMRQVAEMARWSEAEGCEGILVSADNSLVDPWLAAQTIVTHTERLCPLVTVQPVHMHPYAVAKMVASLAFLQGRRVCLNIVAGGVRDDLNALHDSTPRDEQYARVVEYTSLIMALLRTSQPVTQEGPYYRVTNLKMTPPLPVDLMPGVFVSGSSAAGLDAARAIGATAVQYPKPVAEYGDVAPFRLAEAGIQIGIIAREETADAWRVARSRFPGDRRGRPALNMSDSKWPEQLSELGREGGDDEHTPFWLVPFENDKTFRPYLVGSYERVAEEIARYIALGCRTFILDVPPSPDEIEHTRAVFQRVTSRVPS